MTSWRTALLVLAFLPFLVLGACQFQSDEEQDEVTAPEEDTQEDVVISRELNTSEPYYRNVLPFESSNTRGLIGSGVDNRLDIDELELGMMRLAQERYSSNKYILKDGQYLTEDEVQNWIDRKSPSNPNGLNPEITFPSENPTVDEKKQAHNNTPKVLSYVHEQDYFIRKGDDIELGGVVIGISLNSTYYYRVEDDQGRYYFGETPLQDEVIQAEGKRMADDVLQQVRQKEELKDVPITIALYKESSEDEIVPGHFFTKTHVKSGATIDKWQPVNERHYYFPSSEAKTDHRDDAETFNLFKEDVESFFPNYVGVIGKGFYIDNELEQLTVKIPMRFYSKSEVIAFTQYVTTLGEKYLFKRNIPVSIYIYSALDEQESVIVKEPEMKEPMVHIYRE